MSVGIRVGGPTTRTRAPMICSRWMFERATRLCMMSPQIATSRPSQAAASSSDGERVEQRLGRMLVLAVAGVDDGAVDLLRQEIDRARFGVAHDDGVGPHGVQRHRRVEQRLALAHRGGGDVHVDDVGAQPLGRDLEAGAGAGRVLEEQVDHGAARRARRAVCRWIGSGRCSFRKGRAGPKWFRATRPSMPSRWGNLGTPTRFFVTKARR